MEDKKHIIEKLVADNDGILLSITGDKIAIKCKMGHSWFTILGNLKRGYWCPFCAKLDKRLHRSSELINTSIKIVYVRRLKEKVESLGGKLHSEYQKMVIPVKVECKNGHKWEARPKNILQYNSWCPECAKRKLGRYRNPKCHDIDIQQILKQKDAELLSPYVHSKKKVKVKCKNGHISERLPATIKNGWRCRVCADIRRKQKTSAKIEQFLVDTESKLIVPYMGHNKKIVIQCKKGHIRKDLARNIISNPQCLDCEIEQIVFEKGGVFHSKVEKSKKVEIKCLKGHIWRVSYCTIISGNWCPAPDYNKRCKNCEIFNETR